MAKRFFLNTAALSASRLLMTLSQVLILPIIARFLTVEDFGVMALAMTVVLFTQLLSDAGIGRSLIRQKTILPAEWNTVFWMLVGVGAGLMAFMIVTAPLMAWAFDAPRTQGLIMALSVVPALLALSAVPTARMEHDEKFPQLALIQVIAAGIALGLAVWLVFEGAGVWALVAQQIALPVVRCILTFAFSAFRPSLPRGFVPIWNHIRFGRDTIGVAFMFTAQRQIPVMLIGAILGPAILGLYAMSQRIWNIPQMALAGPFSQVVYVRMTRLQDTKGAMAEVYVTALRILSVLVFPAMAVIAAMGPAIFAIALSEPWRAAGSIFALAAGGIALECVTSSAGVMFLAADRTGLRLRMATERTILRVLAIAMALPFGIHAAALALTAFAIFYTPRYFSFAAQADPFSKREAALAMAPAIIVALIAAAGLYIWEGQVDASASTIIAVAAGAIVMGWVIAAGVQFRSLRAGLRVLGR